MKLTNRIMMIFVLTLAALPGFASASGDAKEGAKKIVICGACHGQTGKAAASIYPNLAGQNADYIVSALKAYRAGQRTGGMTAMMTPQAANLSDKDIADIAAYYSEQK